MDNLSPVKNSLLPKGAGGIGGQALATDARTETIGPLDAKQKGGCCSDRLPGFPAQIRQ